MLTETVIVLSAATPWWQILIQVLAPLVAIGIAVGSAIRDNRLRRAAAAATLTREDELALVRARRVLFRPAGGARSGHDQETAIAIENTNEAPIYDVRVTKVTMDGAPDNVEWRPFEPRDGYIQHIPPGGGIRVGGKWWEPGESGELELVDLGFFGVPDPEVTWHDESGRRFRRGLDGKVNPIEEEY